VQAGRKFRLQGHGLPGPEGRRGDLYAVLTVQVPERVTTEERALWEKLAALG
jgi:curved DNA-binding protein